MANDMVHEPVGTPSSAVARRRQRRLQWAASALAIAILALGFAVTSPLSSHADESSIPFSFNFRDLRPGVPATQHVDLAIPRDGDLGGFSLIERTGILESAEFGFAVCESSNVGCADTASLAHSVPVKAGTLHVRVTVTITEQGSGTAVGRLTLTSHDDQILSELASTGTNTRNIALWAAATLTLGAVALIWPRAMTVATRRRKPRAAENTPHRQRNEEGTL